MTAKQQARPTWWTRRFWSLFLGSCVSLVITLATGCQNTPPTSPVYDPLTGVRTPPNTVPVAPKHDAATTNSSSPQASSQGAPPIPTMLATTNTATIAGTSWRTPGSLAIEDRPSSPVRTVTPGQLTNDSKTQQTPISPMPSAKPRIEPVPDAIKPTGQVITPASAVQTQFTVPNAQTVNAASTANADQLLSQQLKERGVTYQWDPVPGGGHLTCVVTGPGGGLYHVDDAPNFAEAAQHMLQQLPPAPR